MGYLNLLLCLCCFANCSLKTFAADYNIKDFDAVSGGTVLNTISIQNAIDAAFKEKGGRVIIPSGVFLTGSLILKSNVELYLSRGAVLLGSTDLSDYFYLSTTTATNKWKALILAQSAESISIGGQGVIDGQGTSLALNIDSLFYIGELDSSLYQVIEKRPKAHARPQLLLFVNCHNIKVTGVTIRNSSSWVQTYDLCSYVVIDKIRVESVAYWNNDGIDIVDCKNVRITNCFINASDDGICVKSYKRQNGLQAYCDSIYIGNCKVRSSASAIKLGTSSFGGFKNVVIENINVFDTYRSAVAIESWETGVLENILVRNIKATNTGNAIFIRLGKREVYTTLTNGILRNVRFENIKVQIPYYQPDHDYPLRGPTLPFFHNIFPISITGIPNNHAENIYIKNVSVVYPGRGNRAYANVPISRLEDVPECVGHYPEFSMFGELPAWGMYVRHVNGLKLENIKLKIKKPDYRPAIVFDDVKNLNLKTIKVSGDKKAPNIIYKNTLHPR